MKRFFLIISFIFLYIIACYSDQFKDWEYWYGSGFLRFSFSIKDDFDYKIIKMEDKRLFVLDIDSRYSDATKYVNINKGNVETLRIGSFNKNTTRVVIKLKYINEVKVYKAKQRIGEDHILFIDVDDYYAISEKKNTKKRFTVTIDPGHGGFDPGAVNKDIGIEEKDLALDIAHKVKWIMEKSNLEKDFDIKLTRDTDIFLPLRKRTDISNKNSSDLFISIHADSTYRKEAKGTSFYYYSKTSSSKEANWVAYKENNEIILRKEKEKDDINLILGDLLDSKNIKYSSVFAGIVKKQFKNSDYRIHGAGVFSANFTVLESSAAPSVLFEMGFISNNEECKKLTSNIYRYNLAKNIVSAIIEYYGYITEDKDYSVDIPDVKVAEDIKDSLIDKKLNRFCINSDFLIFDDKRGNTECR